MCKKLLYNLKISKRVGLIVNYYKWFWHANALRTQTLAMKSWEMIHRNVPTFPNLISGHNLSGIQQFFAFGKTGKTGNTKNTYSKFDMRWNKSCDANVQNLISRDLRTFLEHCEIAFCYKYETSCSDKKTSCTSAQHIDYPRINWPNRLTRQEKSASSGES